jgi:outer membrane lipase/esterase
MRILIAATFAVVLSVSAGAANTLNNLFTGYFAIGDSLSDPGNLFAATGGATPAPPNVNGRFSNGPTFAEAIAAQFDPLTVQNVAFGGARAVDPMTGAPLPLHLDQQLGLYQQAAATGATNGSLVTVLIGANDLLDALGEVAAGTVLGDPTTSVLGAATAAAAAVNTAVSTIVASGPANVVVANLPDLGQVPAFAGTPLAPLATAATDLFNGLLSGITGAATPGTKVTLFDTNAFFDQILADPLAFGVDPSLVTTPCFAAGAGPACSGFLFVDGVHPTTAIHGTVATQIVAAAVPLPAGLPLLAGALGLGLLMGRRRRAA